MSWFRVFSFTGMVGLLLTGCLKPQEFPIEPVIKFKSFTTEGETAFISITFTDGDGDIGFNEGENTPPYNEESVFYHNVFISYYEKVNGVWIQPLNDSGKPYSFDYRTVLLTPEGKSKAIRGEIITHLLPVYHHPALPSGDTIKFRIKICDRALHMSNEVESPEIIVQ